MQEDITPDIQTLDLFGDSFKLFAKLGSTILVGHLGAMLSITSGNHMQDNHGSSRAFLPASRESEYHKVVEQDQVSTLSYSHPSRVLLPDAQRQTSRICSRLVQGRKHGFNTLCSLLVAFVLLLASTQSSYLPLTRKHHDISHQLSSTLSLALPSPSQQAQRRAPCDTPPFHNSWHHLCLLYKSN